MCRTDREKQIIAMTFAFILGAQKTQTPFCFTKYHRHKNNCSYSQNSPFLSSVVVCFVIIFPSANHTCCAFAHKNSLPNFNHTCSRLPSYSHHKNSHGTAETHLGEPQWKQLRECLSLLPARIFSPLPSSFINLFCMFCIPTWKWKPASPSFLLKMLFPQYLLFDWHQWFWGDFRAVCLCTTLPNFADVRKFR